VRAESMVSTDFVADPNTFRGISNGWPALISNLKTLLETGQTLEGI
jgi:hypothetical protein